MIINLSVFQSCHINEIGVFISEPLKEFIWPRHRELGLIRIDDNLCAYVVCYRMGSKPEHLGSTAEKTSYVLEPVRRVILISSTVKKDALEAVLVESVLLRYLDGPIASEWAILSHPNRALLKSERVCQIK